MDGPHDDRVLTTITAHAASMLAIARTHSLCLDDALDAYQRALEIYLRKVDEVRPATAGEWLRTVAKHEAIRLRDQRQRLVSGDSVAWELRLDPDAREPSEHAVAMERVAHAAEALQACKPDESKAMLLKAGGASYAEISARQGWTATKTNRVLTEGRRTFMRRFAAIEAGEACERYAPLLSAVADGEATPEDYVALRPHLRHCAGCRETLRGLYDAQPALGALVPTGALVAVAAAGSGADPELPVRLLGRIYEGLVTGLGDKLVRAQALVEAATTTKAGVVAATAAVAAGGSAGAGGGAERSGRSGSESGRGAGSRSGRSDSESGRGADGGTGGSGGGAGSGSSGGGGRSGVSGAGSGASGSGSVGSAQTTGGGASSGGGSAGAPQPAAAPAGGAAEGEFGFER